MSDDFSLDELWCKCGCGACNIHPESLFQLQRFRSFLGRPITINSACRCIKHNRSVGGSLWSTHRSTASIQCTAYDAKVKDMSCLEIMEILEKHDKKEFWKGRGLYPHENFIHIDSGHSKMTRWIRDATGKYEYVDKF